METDEASVWACRKPCWCLLVRPTGSNHHHRRRHHAPKLPAPIIDVDVRGRLKPALERHIGCIFTGCRELFNSTNPTFPCLLAPRRIPARPSHATIPTSDANPTPTSSESAASLPLTASRRRASSIERRASWDGTVWNGLHRYVGMSVTIPRSPRDRRRSKLQAVTWLRWSHRLSCEERSTV
jgi:hypothetical protein